MKNEGKIIGIDLGTTNSEAAYIKDEIIKGEINFPITINFENGLDILPSIVGIDPKSKEVIVGEKAKNGTIQYPDNFKKEIKRKMGSEEKIIIGNRELLPEEASALILKYIKKYCEVALGEEIKRAVITVPANFNDRQRNATIKAGELAGFIVERIINEPTAAALAYGINNKDNQHVMVYDLGGGTFDVTVLEYNGEVLDIGASAGINQLGGADFDKLLLNYVCDEFKEKNGIDLKLDNLIINRLLNKCEEIKKELSFTQSASLFIPIITVENGKPISLEMDITRTKLESLIKDKIDETEKAINRALKDAHLKKEDIDTILLVGGSTRIPYVRELVERVMGQKPKQDIDPDRAVSLGAAIQGSIIDGKIIIIIMDRCQLSFGTEIMEFNDGKMMPGVYSEVMPCNTSFLKETQKQFTTIFDNQDSIDVKIYQKANNCNSFWVQDMEFLGEKELSNIPPNEAGQESVTLSFLYNLNGMLDVKAKIDSTGESIEFQVETQSYKDEIAQVNINEIWGKSEKASKVKATITVAEKLLKEIGSHKELENKIYKLKEAVVKDDDELIEKFDDELTDLVFDIQED